MIIKKGYHVYCFSEGFMDDIEEQRFSIKGKAYKISGFRESIFNNCASLIIPSELGGKHSFTLNKICNGHSAWFTCKGLLIEKEKPKTFEDTDYMHWFKQ